MAFRSSRIVKSGAALLAASLAFALASCGGTSDKSESGDDGIFTIAASQGINSLDPAKIVFGWEQATYTIVFDALTTYTEDGGGTIQPSLATSWEASDDLKTYDFTLRENVTFSNGKPLTADDVVANFERYLDPKTAWFWRSAIATVDSVEAVDDYTVRMHLSTASRSLPTAVQIAPILDLEDQTDEQLSREPIGSGRFVVTSFVPNGRVVLDRNPDYWGEPAPSSQLVIDRAPDNTSALASLRSGSLDSLFNVPWPDVQAIESAGSTEAEIITQDDPSGMTFFDIDNTSPPFDDVRARQALASAIDRDLILKTVYAGKGTAAEANSPAPAGSDYFDASLPDVPFDLDRAKELFSEAGVDEGTTLTYWTPGAGQYPDFTSIGQILQSDLAKIGITLKIESNELNTWVAKFAPAGKKYPGLIVPNFYSGLAVPGLFSFWNPGLCECNYDNPTFTDALSAADGADSDEASQASYFEALTTFSEDTPVAVLVHTSQPIGVRPSTTGVWIDPTGSPRYEIAGAGG